MVLPRRRVDARLCSTPSPARCRSGEAPCTLCRYPACTRSSVATPRSADERTIRNCRGLQVSDAPATLRLGCNALQRPITILNLRRAVLGTGVAGCALLGLQATL